MAVGATNGANTNDAIRATNWIQCCKCDGWGKYRWRSDVDDRHLSLRWYAEDGKHLINVDGLGLVCEPCYDADMIEHPEPRQTPIEDPQIEDPQSAVAATGDEEDNSSEDRRWNEDSSSEDSRGQSSPQWHPLGPRGPMFNAIRTALANLPNRRSADRISRMQQLGLILAPEPEPESQSEQETEPEHEDI